MMVMGPTHRTLVVVLGTVLAWWLDAVAGMRVVGEGMMIKPRVQVIGASAQPRREVLVAGAAGLVAGVVANPLDAAVAAEKKSMVETAACAYVPREILLRVPDVNACGAFLENALSMRRIGESSWAYGPTSMRRPESFLPGISTFDDDGGHVSIRLEEGPVDTIGNGVAYVQLALPSLRASKILRYGGEIVEAYGVVDVRAPGGLPFRLLLGDEVRDRLMFLALYAADVTKTAAYYKSLGFAAAPYPRARPVTDQESPFDPNPPRGSVYLQLCDDTLGLLLIPAKKIKGNKKPVVGDAYRGLDVFLPDEHPAFAATSDNVLTRIDPDGYTVRLHRRSALAAL